MRERRVVITGLGAVTPVGNTVEEFWTAIGEGRSGMGPITKFDAARYPTRFAAEVKGFDPLRWMEKKEVKKMDPFIHYGLAAGIMAVEDAGLDFTKEDPVRCGALIGSGIGGMTTILDSHKVLLERGPDRVSPFFIPSLIVNMA